MRLLATLLLIAPAAFAADYFPPAGEWQRRTPQQAGMSAARLDEAIAFAKANESKAPRDLERAHYASPFGREPFGDPAGPFGERGDLTGIVVRNGYIVAEWGEPNRVDQTYSVAKSFLSSTVGLAFDRKLIRTVNDRVADAMAPLTMVEDRGRTRVVDLFPTPHAKSITWDHLLRQTSDWQGTLWGKPDWADRPAPDLEVERARARLAPGSAYEYNDTRVNLLALAALNVWRRPLPQVLREHVMDPIGASATWRWHGYDTSWVLLDGTAVQSVSGGSHWGGGMFINAYDQARFGLLTLHRGRWREKQIISEEWIRMSLTPTPVQKNYGFMNYFLSPGGSFTHLGAGTNAIHVDPAADLVVVVRWIERQALQEFISKVIAAVETGNR
ncbi:MAG TPA: serine hydrolase [Thermoanaerobaculia bacterium]|nr:serine hydrolase [Thermoanaerobaculia bacterium]